VARLVIQINIHVMFCFAVKEQAESKASQSRLTGWMDDEEEEFPLEMCLAFIIIYLLSCVCVCVHICMFHHHLSTGATTKAFDSA